MIIGLSGYIGSGKDTVGKIIQEITTVKGHVCMEDEFGNPLLDTKGNYVTYPNRPIFKIEKFAGILKQIASIMLGVPVEKFEDQEYKSSYLPEQWDYDYLEMVEQGVVRKERRRMTVREFLQKLGTDAVRNKVHSDAWVNALMTKYDNSKPNFEDDYWIITDVRFPNEARAIKERGGIIIRINRYPPGCSPELMDRTESEVALDDWNFDHVIYNVGTIDDLTSQIKNILENSFKITS